MKTKINYFIFFGLGFIFNYFVQVVEGQNVTFSKVLQFAIAYGVLIGLAKKFKITLVEYIFLVVGLVSGGILLIYLFGFKLWYIFILVTALAIGFHTQVLLRKSK